MNKKNDIMFASNSGLFQCNWGKFDWWQKNGFHYKASEMVFDAKNPFLFTFNATENSVFKSYIDQNTYSVIDHEDDILFCKDIQACHISGDAYILTNKDLVDANNGSNGNIDGIFGGELIYYSNFIKEASTISLTRENENYRLFGASSIAYDYVRHRLWVADTFNHQIININTTNWEIETIINRNDVVFPSCVTVNIVTGDVFIQAYYSDGLQEVIVIIREKEVNAIFTTPGCFGWSDNDYPMNYFFVLENHSENNTTDLHKIDVATGSQSEIGNHYDDSYIAMTADPINKNVVSYNAGGVGQVMLYDKTHGGVTPTSANVNIDPFVCLTDGQHWYFSVRLDGLPSISLVKVGADNGTIITFLEAGIVSLRNPSCGDVLHFERCPVVIENEEYLAKISNKGERIEKRITMPQTCNVIATHLSNEIATLKREDQYIYTFDSNLNLTGTYDLGANAMAIVAHHSVENVYWVLFEGNVVKKVELKDDLVNVLGSVTISASEECIGLRYDFNYRRPLVYSRKDVYCVSEGGNSLVWSREGFDYIGDIATTNNFFAMYTKHKWFTRKNMKYDVLRNKLWWISRGQDDYSCCLNEDLMSVSSFKLPKPVIKFEYDSSSSSSSFL
jgi:hypothetical protein